MNEQWMYRTLDSGLSEKKFTEAINLLGAKGWEAVGYGVTSNMAGLLVSRSVLLKKFKVSDADDPYSQSKDNEAGKRLTELMKERRES
ncbi:unannotated protein [freshwater metagenome]|uniref:Unannotated protein n=1 Tax=freshwater metagenome TaxID=449393 RepID=A0A6J6GKX8_9ZZZZ|nr:hypothetical protein [Actinomycetota bacterium]